MPNLRDHFQSVLLVKALTGRLKLFVLDKRRPQAKSVRAFCMEEIKAIETKYNGYKFRSRLEARWAVFFDELEVAYEYEPEGFDLSGVFSNLFPGKTASENLWYLPDFYLPDYGWYVEIKPSGNLEQHKESLAKCGLLAHVRQIFVVVGSPGSNTYNVYPLNPVDSPTQSYVFSTGRKCDRLWLSCDETGAYRALNCDNCWSSKCGDKTPWDHLGMDKAYEAARSARF